MPTPASNGALQLFVRSVKFVQEETVFAPQKPALRPVILAAILPTGAAAHFLAEPVQRGVIAIHRPINAGGIR